MFQDDLSFFPPPHFFLFQHPTVPLPFKLNCSMSSNPSPDPQRSPSPWTLIKETLGVMHSPASRPPTPPDLSGITIAYIPNIPCVARSQSLPRAPTAPVFCPPTLDQFILDSQSSQVPAQSIFSTQNSLSGSHCVPPNLPQTGPPISDNHDQPKHHDTMPHPLASHVSSSLIYPPPSSREYSQAPTVPGPLSAASQPGLTRLELAKTTRDEHVETMTKNKLAINEALLTLPLMPPEAI